MLNKTPWLPCKPSPQYVRRVTFLTAIKNWLSDKYAVLVEKWRWKYYGFVYQTKNPLHIRRALATDAAAKLYNMRAPVRAVQAKLIADALRELPAEVTKLLERGTTEYNGWKELPNSLDAVLWVSWCPRFGPRRYMICAPSMAVLVRDRQGYHEEDEYDPHFADKLYKIPEDSHFNLHVQPPNPWALTVEREREVLGRTLTALANAIRVEEQARADAK